MRLVLSPHLVLLYCSSLNFFENKKKRGTSSTQFHIRKQCDLNGSLQVFFLYLVCWNSEHKGYCLWDWCITIFFSFSTKMWIQLIVISLLNFAYYWFCDNLMFKSCKSRKWISFEITCIYLFWQFFLSFIEQKWNKI